MNITDFAFGISNEQLEEMRGTQSDSQFRKNIMLSFFKIERENAIEVLEDEISDNHLELLNSNKALKDFIIDAMIEFKYK